MRARSLLAACAAALTLLATGASVARADNVVVDGDILTNGTQNPLTLGSIACNTPVEKTQALWINRNGNYDTSNAFKAGSSVQVSASISGTNRSSVAVTALDAGIAVPANWDQVDNNTVTSDKASFRVTVNSPTAGTDQTATVRFTATGKDADNNSLTRSVDLTVSWSTQSCVTNTPPKVSVTGVSNGASYTFGAVPTAGCAVTDAEDSNPSATPVITPNDGNVGPHTVTCAYTDDGGLKAQASATYTVTPATPTIVLTCSNATYDAAAHECTSVVNGIGGTAIPGAVAPITYDRSTTDAGTVTATATYAGSGNYGGATATTTYTIGQATPMVTLACPTGVIYDATAHPCTATVKGIGDELAGAPVTITYTRAGNASTDVTNAGSAAAHASYAGSNNYAPASADGVLTIGKATPTVTLSCPTGVTYDAGAHPCTATVQGIGDELAGAPVTITYTRAGNAGTDVTNAGSAAVHAAYAGSNNYAPASADDVLTIAKATPTITLVCPGDLVWDGAAHPCTATVKGVGDELAGAPVTITYTRKGVATTDLTGVGTLGVTASYAGSSNYNPASTSGGFTITAWTLNGFYQPVDMGSVVNTVKAGSTVPLKFEVFAGSTKLTSTSTVKSFAVKGITCNGGTADDVELVTTGGTSLRYDTTAGQFVQNWQTPKTAGSCYQVTMTTQDGSSLSANFKLK